MIEHMSLESLSVKCCFPWRWTKGQTTAPCQGLGALPRAPACSAQGIGMDALLCLQQGQHCPGMDQAS